VGRNASQWQHITDINFHRSGLLDQTDTEHKAMPLLLPEENPPHALERAVEKRCIRERAVPRRTLGFVYPWGRGSAPGQWAT
jgi:hypothetical protein